MYIHSWKTLYCNSSAVKYHKNSSGLCKLEEGHCVRLKLSDPDVIRKKKLLTNG